MSETAGRRVGAWLPAWAAILLLLAALAGRGDLPAPLRAHVASGRLAANAGLLLLGAVALVLSLRRGGPRRLLSDLVLTLVLAAPFAAAAWDWTPLDGARAGPYLALLGSLALLALAASSAGVDRPGGIGSIYLAAIVLLLLGAPFLSYLLAETTPAREGAWRFLSAVWAARPLLLDREPALPAGHWTPAVAANLTLAAGFAARALLRRRRRP